MCGRYTMLMGEQELESRFKAKFILPKPDFHLIKNNNASPSQMLPVVTIRESKREIHLLQWGLETFWSKKQGSKIKPINARGEGISTKPFFRNAFVARRCLIPATGFFEWKASGEPKKKGERKTKYHFSPEDSQVCSFAGLWESGDASSENPSTFTIITLAANSEISDFHDRMPCFLSPHEEDIWMGNPKIDEDWFHTLAIVNGELKLRIQSVIG